MGMLWFWLDVRDKYQKARYDFQFCQKGILYLNLGHLFLAVKILDIKKCDQKCLDV